MAQVVMDAGEAAALGLVLMEVLEETELMHHALDAQLVEAAVAL